MHASLVAQMMALTTAGKGITDGLSGDRFYASLNGALCASHKCGAPCPLWEDGRPGSASLCGAAIRGAGERNASRRIAHVLLAGYDTNLCMVDKPCGAVTLSTKFAELLGEAAVVLLRDVTRPRGGAPAGAGKQRRDQFYGNAWATWQGFVNMIESAPWLPPARRSIRSTTLPDLLRGFGLADALKALRPPQYRSERGGTWAASAPEAASQLFPSPAAPPDLASALAALVVVSAATDFANDGFQARVSENLERRLCPLIRDARAAGLR
eukprot:gene2026-20883_t